MSSMAKPISEMTDDEVLEYIEWLRNQRKQRREEMIAAKTAPAVPKAPGAPKPVKPPRLGKNEVDELTANILRNILGDDLHK